MSQKGTMKIGNDKKDMILQNPHVHAGSMQEKEEGRSGRFFFRNYYFSTTTLLLPLEVKGKIIYL